MKANSQVELLTERYNGSLGSLEAQKSETHHLQARSQNLQETVHKLQASNEHLTQELLGSRRRLENASTETANLKAEIKLLKSMEARLREENEALSRERGQLAELLRKVQSLQSALDQNEASSRKFLEGRVRSLEQELLSTQSKLEGESFVARSLSLAKESELQKVSAQLDSLKADYSKLSVELATAHTTNQHLSQRVQELAATRAANRPSSDEGGGGDSSLRGLLLSMQLEKSSLQEQLEEYRAIAKANEEALAALHVQLAEVLSKANDDAALAEKERSRAKSLLGDAEDAIETSHKQLAEVQALLSREREEWSNQRAAYEETIHGLQEHIADVEEREEGLKHEVKMHLGREEEAHRNYQKELVNHAADVQALDGLRTEHSRLRSHCAELEEQLVSAHSSLEVLQSSCAAERKCLRETLSSCEERCEDLVKQNEILHRQLDRLADEMAQLRQQPSLRSVGASIVRDATRSPVDSAENAVSELREVVRFLRRDNEVLQCQFNLAQQESKRLKRHVEQCNETIEEMQGALRDAGRGRALLDHREAEESERENQLSILRESNTTLREENRGHIHKIERLEEELCTLKSQLDPLNENLKDREVEVEACQSEIATLREDNNRWTTRVREILERCERIDPVEHQKIVEENGNMKEEISQLTHSLASLTNELQEVAEKNAAREKKTARLGEQVKSLKKRIGELSSQNKQKTKEAEEQLSETKKACDELASLREQLQNCEKEKRQLEALSKDGQCHKHEEAIALEKKKCDQMRQKALLYFQKMKTLDGELKQIRSQYSSEQQTVIDQAVLSREKELEIKYREDLKNHLAESSMRSKLRISMLETRVQKLSDELEDSRTLLRNATGISRDSFSSKEAPAPTSAPAPDLTKPPAPSQEERLADEGATGSKRKTSDSPEESPLLSKKVKNFDATPEASVEEDLAAIVDRDDAALAESLTDLPSGSVELAQIDSELAAVLKSPAEASPKSEAKRGGMSGDLEMEKDALGDSKREILEQDLLPGPTDQGVRLADSDKIAGETPPSGAVSPDAKVGANEDPLHEASVDENASEEEGKEES